MRRCCACLVLVLGAVVVVACGKKGPPLAPIVRIPAGIETITTQRVGNDIYLTLTVPIANIDMTRPVDIVRVELYGYTGHSAPPRGRFAEAATLVAAIPVTPPAPGAPDEMPADAPAPAAAALAGSTVTVVDNLTAEEFVQGATLTIELPRGARPLPTAPEPPPTGPLKRYYLAVGISSRGEPGPQATPAEVTLFPLPDPPSDVRVAVTSSSTVVAWDPPGGLVGFLFESPLPPERSPDEDPFAVPRADVSSPRQPPAGSTAYNVYVRRAPDPTPPAPDPAAVAIPEPPPWAAAPAAPINPAPLTATQLSDTVEFGRERCYSVRTVRGAPPNVLVSNPSPETCITAVDTFPPAVPAGVAAVAGETSISLIWEFGTDPDLAGYLILRGEAGDATLQPLTPTPISGASFVDENVMSGRRYAYAVVAVDTAGNRSVASARVEETAR